MVEVKLLSIILWSITASVLVIFIIISSFIYRTNHDKTFKYYALYCFFLLIYVVYKFDFYEPFLQWLGTWRNQGFNWMIQVLYHAFYAAFGISFLEFPKYYPALNKGINYYFKILLIIGFTGIAVSFLPLVNYSFYTTFFLYIFLPPHLILAIFIAVKALKSKAHARYYFTSGSLTYMLLAMYALFVSYKLLKNPFSDLMDSIDFFFIAIIFESLIFSYGLSHRVRLLYNQKILVQKELDTVQQMIQEKLKEEINLQQKENIILLEQKQKQELITRVAFLQQKVLRSQINSHFIFNVLNSIKLFILENDAPKASFYLGKFARFIRAVLDSSEHEQTNLADEIDTIELYLNIEQMRFNDKFTYEFDVQKNLNLSEYPFPPLLLQPFVENALWHGLMQIEKNARLLVRIYENSNGLIIEIDDNGIGYNKSVTSKKNEHKSLGLKIAKERIEHYNQRLNFYLVYTIIDKSDIQKGEGTIARITLEKVENIDFPNNTAKNGTL